jgi:hypothetical protein
MPWICYLFGYEFPIFKKPMPVKRLEKCKLSVAHTHTPGRLYTFHKKGGESNQTCSTEIYKQFYHVQSVNLFLHVASNCWAARELLSNCIRQCGIIESLTLPHYISLIHLITSYLFRIESSFTFKLQVCMMCIRKEKKEERNRFLPGFFSTPLPNEKSSHSQLRKKILYPGERYFFVRRYHKALFRTLIDVDFEDII